MKATIRIKSKMPQEKEPIELVTQGDYEVQGDHFVVTYEESAVTGMEGTQTTLKNHGQDLILARQGAFNSILEFSKSEKKICLYDTPYGTFEMVTDTKTCAINANDSNLLVDLVYDLSIMGEDQGRAELYISCTTDKAQ